MITPGIDTFITLEEANAYHSKRLTATRWGALADEEKEAALVSAFTEIVSYESSTSTLDWENAPVGVKQAQAEHALDLSAGSQESEGLRIKKIGGDSGDVEFFEEEMENNLSLLVENLLRKSGYFYDVSASGGGYARIQI